MTRVALVTGASSGIGQASARALAAAGFQVFGTSRTPALGFDEPFEMLTLDVRSDASVAEAIEHVLERTGRIDVLVNNAGVSQSGAVEEVSVAQVQAQFDTNVFGVLRMTQAVLPTMRAQGSGRIINISSVLGQVAPPFLGVYASSKFAIEGLSEALRGEVRPLGIWVSLVEPAFVETRIGGDGPATLLDAYGAMRAAGVAFARDGLAHGLDAHVVGATIVRIARQARPGLRYRVGRRATLLTTLKRVLPEVMFERVSQRVFQPQAR